MSYLKSSRETIYIFFVIPSQVKFLPHSQEVLPYASPQSVLLKLILFSNQYEAPSF